MKTRIILISCMLIGVCSSITALDQNCYSAKPERWVWEGNNIEIYTPENLYDYIDGAADIYLAYGFKRLGVLTYKDADNKDKEITLEYYVMESSDDAFGIYSMMREPEYRSIDLFDEAFLTETELVIWANKYMIRIKDLHNNLDDKDLLSFGRERFTGGPPSKRPIILDYLPKEGLVKNSERFMHGQFELKEVYYLPDNPLCLGPDTDIAWADYKKDGDKFNILLVSYKTAEKAVQGEKGYIEYLKGAGYKNGGCNFLEKRFLKDGKYILCGTDSKLLYIIKDVKDPHKIDLETDER